MLDSNIVNLCYLVAAVLFILDLKWMAHPRTAVRGNRAGAIAMALAVGATLLSDGYTLGAGWITAGLAIGTVIGLAAAIKVKMTTMPEMVGLFNGFGGAASILVAGAALVAAMNEITAPGMQTKVATVASALIGSVTFFGSYVAFGKLAEFLAVKWKLYPWQNAIKYGFSFVVVGAAVAYAFATGWNEYSIVTVLAAAAIGSVLLMKKGAVPFMGTLKLIVAFGSLAAAYVVVREPGNEQAFWMLVAVSGALGVLVTWSIGGADMPVVVALLNSYSGLAAAATGFVINNSVLIISGSLVGASGIVLTMIMCKAMNRSLVNVMFSTMGPTADTPDADEVYKTVKSTSADEVVMMIETAQRVVIVPGYGMAVAQAQHAVRDFANLVEEKFGANVEFAIHPVAGRMPGHMNVLLAEADVSYDKLKEMDEINSTIETVDVCIVVGANDVVNPVARTDPNSPIAGMPIIDVDKARTVVVIKRSLSPGFAGIPNPLFANENTTMFFSDAKKAFGELNSAVKDA